MVLAPSVALEPGARYTVASGAPRFATALVATASSAWPLLLRAWPPRGAGADATLAVWCGASPLPPLAGPAVLEPGGPTGTLERGAVSAEGGPACARFVADPDDGAESGASGDGPFAAPLRLGPDLDAPLALLEPGELAAAVPVPEPVAPLACHAAEVPFGPGCARVADDRLLVRAPGAPLLWSLHTGGRDWVRPTAALEPFVLAPLAPATEMALVVQTLDVAGRTTRADVACTTATPAAHLVVNEVLANPVGAEPAQEWVELYNDGLAPAALGGLALVDPGDTVILPDAVLPPGGFALVVNQAFDATPPFDVPPAAGTTLVRVSGLTLTNQGDPLLLEDANGVELTRFDAAVKPKSGRSVMRVAPAAPDGWPASFALADTPTPGAPNAPP
ncbi:MAG: lamin tail domain-containing protein [Polyangiaceae bacterium]|nr:lamin tail domain-containing protein [Polyangiaceae bacterium]